MKHKYYYEFSAQTPHELGYQMGLAFKEEAFLGIERAIEIYGKLTWKEMVESTQHLYVESKKYFPDYIEEFNGYADGARIDRQAFWTLSLERDAEIGVIRDKCTTIVTNSNSLILHIEEGDFVTKTETCIVKKTLGKKSKLGIFYYNSLDGNACGYSSDGLIYTGNTLYTREYSVGIPRNIICRYISDMKSLPQLKKDFGKYRRMSGYNWNILNLKGKGINIESTAKDFRVSEISTDEDAYVHTNHYLTDLSSVDELDEVETVNLNTSKNRYEFAKKSSKKKMTAKGLMKCSDEIFGHMSADLHSYMVDARMIVDVKAGKAYFHLEREAEKGWIAYPLEI